MNLFRQIRLMTPVIALIASMNYAQALEELGEEDKVFELHISDCSRCHTNEAMRPAKIGADSRLHFFFVDPQRFKASIHYRKGKVNCKDCHEKGYEVFPHKAAKSLECLDCHDKMKAKFEEIIAEAKQSVHFKSEKAGFSCGACHTPHYMKHSRDMTLTEKNEMCIKCHNDRFNTSGYTLSERHSWHPLSALHLGKTACISCHTQPAEGVSEEAFKHKILTASEASRDCADCHSPGGKMVHYLIDIGETPKTDYTDEELIKNFYLTGATRVAWMDFGGLALILATLLGIIGHGALRFYYHRRGER